MEDADKVKDVVKCIWATIVLEWSSSFTCPIGIEDACLLMIDQLIKV